MQENKSQNANFILKKLKKELKITTDIELSEILNVKPNTISSWKKRNTVDYNSIISISNLYEIDLNSLFLDSKNLTKNDIFSSCETALLAKELQYQYCMNDENLADNLPRYHFPFIKKDETMAFQVSGNNMFPIIEENSFAICELTSLNQINDNDIVVVISKLRGFFINKIVKSPQTGKFHLVNENTFFNNIEIDEHHINEIWIVKAILSYNINKYLKPIITKNKDDKPFKKII